LSTTAPPPPPAPNQLFEIPPPPEPPPPTTNTRTDETPVGTCQLQLPSVAKVTIVSPFDAVVEVKTQLFAIAGMGIETKRLVSNIVETIVAILERSALAFMRTKPKITFTSLLRAVTREA
jgi:hypothetical protein